MRLLLLAIGIALALVAGVVRLGLIVPLYGTGPWFAIVSLAAVAAWWQPRGVTSLILLGVATALGLLGITIKVFIPAMVPWSTPAILLGVVLILCTPLTSLNTQSKIAQ